MVSRRQETNFTTTAPVRFYKIVALTFLILTIILLGIIIFMSSKRATITITTKAEPVDATTEVVVGASGKNGNIPGMVTSTVVHLSQVFQPTGNRELAGVAAGTATIHNETNSSQPLVATTRLLTGDGVLFRLRNRVTVPANGAVDAAVYADREGKSGDIGPSRFTIPGLHEDKQKVIYATSDAPMTGGVKTVGILSDDDIKKAEKKLRGAIEDVGGKRLSLFFPGKDAAYGTFEYIADTRAIVGDEVSEFVLNGKAKIVGIFYDGDQLRAKAVAALQKKSVSDTEVIEPSKEPPTVTLERYDADSGIATLAVFQGGQSVLNPESKEIQNVMFFGKSKDEVRRYLLSLSHVHAVDVTFHPAWMLSVPSIPDHVEVIVKNVE